MDILTRCLAVSTDVKTVTVDNSLVLIHLKRGQYYGLDEVGMHIWELIKVGRTGNEIVDVLTDGYDASVETVSTDTRNLIEALIDAEMVH